VGNRRSASGRDVRDGPLLGPYNNWAAASAGFLSEIAAWVAGPWAVAVAWHWALAIPAAVVLIGIPAVFSTPRDKRRVLVPTPGPIRALIEVGLFSIAIVSAWYVWPAPLAVGVTAVVAVTVLAGFRRLVWLFSGAR
jgi:hypothetical protein